MICHIADDTQLGTATKDVKTTIEILNDDLVNISVWMAANKLSLNKSKTIYIYAYRITPKTETV